MITWSGYIKHISHLTTARIMSIALRKVEGELHDPNRGRTHYHAPKWNVNSVGCLSSSATGICQ